MKLNDLLTNKQSRCMGDVWADERVQMIFKDIDLEKDNRIITKSVFEYVKFLKELANNGWIQYHLTINEAKKLNAIIKCKTISTLKNKLDKFSYEITKDRYDRMFHKNKIACWEMLKVSLLKLIEKGELNDLYFLQKRNPANGNR